MKKVLLVGGGSGGHITPPLAVAHELKRLVPTLEIHYALEKGSKFADLPRQHPDITAVHTIYAGKFRRYHGESFWQHVKDLPTVLKNIRDLFVFILGMGQSVVFLRRLKPEAVFIKGGFVGVPIGLACALWRIPFFTHDSDTVPGLANRLIARWAQVHAVGMPAEFYTYPREKTKFVGIPISSDYRPVTASLQAEYRQHLGIAAKAPVICVTGGSLGAVRLNAAVIRALPALLKKFPDLHVLHQTGQTDARVYDTVASDVRAHVTKFAHTTQLYCYSGAADIVIARAGATTIAELAAQAKAAILVPNPALTGGQQSKNAEHLQMSTAAVILSEAAAADTVQLVKQISNLLESKHQRDVLASNIRKLAKPDAAVEIARLTLRLAEK